MIYLLLGLLCLGVFCLLLYKEPRRFLNVILLLIAAVLLFVGFAQFTAHLEYLQSGIFFFMLFVVPGIILLMAIMLIINGFMMLRKEGKRLANLLSLLTGFAVIIGLASLFLLLILTTLHTLLMSTLWLIGILSVYFAMTFSALLIYSLLYLKLPKDLCCDYIIIHGCGLLDGKRVSPLLKGRIDKGVEIFQKLEGQAKLVLSGGKGADEALSEAEAMKNYLLEQGFPAEDIILENQSATTYENLRNVKELLDTEAEGHRYIFVTNDFHVFRTGLYAKKLNMNALGVGCKTAAYYWPSAFIREYVAVMVKYKWITIAVLALWLLLTILSLLPI